MSLNWVMLTQDGTAPVPLPQEKMFFTQSHVKLVLDCNETPGGYPGNSEGYFESNKGTVILSNQRIVYLVQEASSEFKNLNIPILNFKNWKLEQPWFGANFVSGVVLPVQGGGLRKASNLKLTFTEGGKETKDEESEEEEEEENNDFMFTGAIEFTTILRNLLERIEESNEIPREYEPLPAYPQQQQQQQQPPTDDLPPSYSA